VRPVALGASLVDVADEQVRAALVAELADLPQQLLDRDRGVLGAAPAQVVAVGVNERGPVLRRALQPLGLIGAGVALDRVEGQVQAARAVQQADALAEQVVDLLPALERRLGALSGLDWAGLGPAGGVRRDFLPDGLAEAVPQVPAVADLDRAGQCLVDGLAVGARAVTAHDLDPWMAPQPLLGDVSGAAGDDVDAPAGPGVDEHRRVDQAAAQREVDPQHPRHRQGGKGDPQQDPQRGMPGNDDAQRWQQARPGANAGRLARKAKDPGRRSTRKIRGPQRDLTREPSRWP
jgi:hypothetical protein